MMNGANMSGTMMGRTLKSISSDMQLLTPEIRAMVPMAVIMKQGEIFENRKFPMVI